MDSAQPGMNAAQQFVVVKAPLERVYEQWSRFEDLPKFIPPLRGVRRIDDMHFSYVWHPNGEDKPGIFQIVLQIDGRRIAWRTMSNGFMSGVVSFEPRSERETEVILKIRSIFDPANLSRRVEEYLGNFKGAAGKSGGQRMRRVPTVEELVASYWQRLARSIERPNVRKSRALSPLRRRNSERLRRRNHGRVAA